MSIIWRSSDRSTITDTDRGFGKDIIRKGTVKRGLKDKVVRLTAIINVPGEKPVSFPIKVTVLAKPRTSAENEAYMFVYFAGDTPDGEKLRFAVSEGNNALNWQDLNDAQPILESATGTLGLRDPFIMRSAEGDRFFLLATDLSAGRSGWSKATDEGSSYLEIWESTDLINWGQQRHVKVSKPNAGMTWAPEAMYDPTIDAYVVYWTSHMFLDDARTHKDDNGPQILTSITRDFRTFGEPEPWFKASDLPDLLKDKGMIDSSVMKDGEYYYRFTKVTDAKGCPSPDILAQRSKSLRATTESGAWSLVDRCIGRNAGTPEVEGPSAFIANKGDTSGFKYYLWVDHFGGIGYIPLGTNALDAPIKWTYPPNFRLPAHPRHGSVLAITAKERDALLAKWGTKSPEAPQINASEAEAAEIFDAWVVPPVLSSGTPLPAPAGFSVLWTADGAKLIEGALINDQTAPASVKLTGMVRLSDGKTITKCFDLTLLGKDARFLAAYTRSPTSAHEANQPIVARSLHLAIGTAEGDLKPLNDNYGVLFPSGDYVGVDQVSLRGLSNPSLFYFSDGSLGVIANRVDMTGALDPTYASGALVFKSDPKSPADFTELGFLDLRTGDGVVAPKAVWDSAAKRYLVYWRSSTGAAKWTTVADLARTELRGSAFNPENNGRRLRIVSQGNVGVVRTSQLRKISDVLPPPSAANLPDAEAPMGIAISPQLASALENRFGRIVNVGARVAPLTIKRGDIAAIADAKVQLDYSDGSITTRKVDWNPTVLKRLQKARPGNYTVTGTVRQSPYPRIFAYNRADPTIYRYAQDSITRYLFTATDDTDNQNVNSPHLPLRVANSIEALADANGGGNREIDLLNRRVYKDRTLEGRVIAGCYWAPELHEIGGRLTILFAPCFNSKDDQSNEDGLWSTVEAHMMQLREGGDPAKRADWSKPAAVRRANGASLGRTEFGRNISLDMSYFDIKGQGYYIWSQRYITETGNIGDPLTWIAKVDPANPARLTSEPQPLIAPNLSFEENLAEGAFAFFHEGRIYLAYSGSKVGPTYVVGGMWAEEGADLTDINSWRKWKAPLQKSTAMPTGTRDYLTYEQGPGHGSFAEDADGNLTYVYHTWGDGVGGNGRDTRVRRVHWAADGRPVLDMMPEEEVAPKYRQVSIKVTIARR
ncbi:hypothetical protein ABENE_20150 [Asticcacaulis benevestitus DSM 16100 = ATCC BAA-896]|uniref:Bacterial Ig-like domain-containing protein n=1 Tax=Asticcacaulis benevestitus DSM 16100 = ATCC BAA-896 TaxID=1121022 RepID=V4P6C7_9CAUL|nr:hypothetical protein ABENE_20150 [Asticcacaulis benevestitus DSM 16100 = ATCC BAA-896]